MSLVIKNGLVKINETSEDRIMNFHLQRGFAILTAFRSEYELSENRARNRELMRDLKANGFSFAKVTGGYSEQINETNPHWDEAEPIKDDTKNRRYVVMEESLLVPMFDVKTKEVITDTKSFEKIIVKLGTKYEQDSVLIAPPKGEGQPKYIVTDPRSGQVGSVSVQFDKLTIASVADIYFTMKEKTLAKAHGKRREGNAGVKFEGAWLDEPAHTISGVRARDANNEIAPFGSHYAGMSSISDFSKKVESLSKRLTKIEKYLKLNNNK